MSLTPPPSTLLLLLFLKKFFFKFIYFLAAAGLSSGMWDFSLQCMDSLLWREGFSLVVALKLQSARAQ